MINHKCKQMAGTALALPHISYASVVAASMQHHACLFLWYQQILFVLFGMH